MHSNGSPFRWLLALLVAATPAAMAADTLPPLLPIFERNAGFDVGTQLGLFGSLIESRANERTTRDAEAFHQRVEDVDLAKLVGASLACVGLPASTELCREVITLREIAGGDTASSISESLITHGSSQALVATVLLRFTGNTYSARTVVREVSLVNGMLQQTRQNTVVYATRAPKTLVDQGKTEPEVLDSIGLRVKRRD